MEVTYTVNRQLTLKEIVSFELEKNAVFSRQFSKVDKNMQTVWYVVMLPLGKGAGDDLLQRWRAHRNIIIQPK